MSSASEEHAERALLEMIRGLSPERLRQVAARLSEDAFRRVWDNADDAEYDRL